MFKVLIAEDELIVRIGIKNSIDWEKLGMKVIADVPNGQAALEIYEKEKPDLILTDIKMPVMDGMQLITKIRENDSHTKIIILTCYEEFDFVHKALKLGVTDYILKLKMLPSDIEKILIKSCEELKKENETKPQPYGVKVDHTYIKEKVIKDYLFYNLYSESTFAELLNKVNFKILPERMVMCLMSIEQFEVLQKKLSDNEGGLIRFAVLNIIEELLGTYNRGEAIYVKEDKYILIFSFSDVISESGVNDFLHDILSRINYVIQTYFDTAVAFAISGIYSGFLSLKGMYGECIAALEQRYFIADEKYVRYNSAVVCDIKSQVFNKLQIIVNQADKLSKEYSKEIESGIEVLMSIPELKKRDLTKYFLRWTNWLIINLNMQIEGMPEVVLKYTDLLHKCTNLDMSIDLFIKYLEEVKQNLQDVKCYSKEVFEAIKFIKSNFHKDISLQQVAENVEMSPNYLSSLFKKEVQMNLIEYINQVRIEKAKEILLSSSLKTYEVAEKVGFTDESYFSRTFKKFTGIRPVEYRKKWLRDVKEVR